MGNFKLEKFHAVSHELLKLKYELSSSFWIQQVKLATPQFTVKYYGCSSLLFDALLQRNVRGFLLVCHFIIIYYLVLHCLSHECQDFKPNPRTSPLLTILKWKSKRRQPFNFIAMYDEGCRENNDKPLFIYFSYSILFTVMFITQKGLGLRLRHVRNLPVVKNHFTPYIYIFIYFLRG